jgi:hypothetical protein
MKATLGGFGQPVPRTKRDSIESDGIWTHANCVEAGAVETPWL